MEPLGYISVVTGPAPVNHYTGPVHLTPEEADAQERFLDAEQKKRRVTCALAPVEKGDA